jgi:hypothetical protein
MTGAASFGVMQMSADPAVHRVSAVVVVGRVAVGLADLLHEARDLHVALDSTVAVRELLRSGSLVMSTDFE